VSKTVLLACEKPFSAAARDEVVAIIKQAGYTANVLESYKGKGPLLDAIASADAAIVRSDAIDAEVLEAAKQLKLVVRAGAGYDTIDTATAKAKGVAVMNTPGQNANAVAELWHRLMAEGLGYPRYAAHGSDLGAGVTAWLARAHPGAVAGIHLANPGLAAPPRPWTAAEAEYLAQGEGWAAQEGGYAHEQATKPATLAAALHDSPAGLAAWIGEKVVAWSSATSDGQPAFARELLLGTLTLYWATGTIGSSLLPYWAYRHSPGSALPAGSPPAVRTAISVFGGERVPFPKPPRELAERYFTVTAWDEHDRGGHFPAVAEPELLAQTLREVFRPARGAR